MTPRAIRRLKIRHPRGETEVRIGAGALAPAVAELAPWLRDRTLFVLTAPPVRRLHGPALAALTTSAARVVELEVEDGEGAKTLVHAERLWRQMLTAGGKRDSRLLAFGGGTVGDLGGFVAGCFLRGIAVAQVPTTLLAQVDASLGGKTAVDLPEGKNTVGLFHHPDWVIADTRLLATLDPAELRAGLVEVIKMACLLDLELLDRVERDLESLLAGDPPSLVPVVAGAVAAKRAVVERDPEEGDQRRLLNLGHTLAHAIEAVLGYRRLRHGEAVAYGMLFALRLAARRSLDPHVVERLRRLLARLDLPSLGVLDAGALIACMTRDKKARERGLVWVLPSALGAAEMVSDLDMAWVRRELEDFLTDPWGRDSSPVAQGRT